MKNTTEEILNNIIETTKTCFYIYSTLIRLEKEGLKDTNQYKDVLESLYLAIEDEESSYEYFIENIDKAAEANNILAHMIGNKSQMSLARLLVNGGENHLINARITKKLNNLILSLPNNFVLNLSSEELDCINNEDLSDGYSFLYEILPLLDKTTHLMLSSYLDDAITLEKDSVITSLLIQVKYYLSFLNIHLEGRNISDGFIKISNEFEKEMTFDLDEISPDSLIAIKNLHGTELTSLAVNELFEYHDQDYHNKSIYVKIIISTCLLQTATLYVSKDELKNLEAEIQEELLDISFQDQTFKKYILASKIIQNVFSKSEQIKTHANKDLDPEEQFKY